MANPGGITEKARNRGQASAPTGKRFPTFDALPTVFRRYPEIQAVYLFGSYATNTPHPESDIDLAIVAEQPTLREKRLDILSDLAAAGFCDVDLVFLDTPDIVLQYEAVRHNKVLYQTADFDRGGVFSKIIRQYFDFLPYLKVQREAYKRRILGD